MNLLEEMQLYFLSKPTIMKLLIPVVNLNGHWKLENSDEFFT